MSFYIKDIFICIFWGREVVSYMCYTTSFQEDVLISCILQETFEILDNFYLIADWSPGGST